MSLMAATIQIFEPAASSTKLPGTSRFPHFLESRFLQDIDQDMSTVSTKHLAEVKRLSSFENKRQER